MSITSRMEKSKAIPKDQICRTCRSIFVTPRGRPIREVQLGLAKDFIIAITKCEICELIKSLVPPNSSRLRHLGLKTVSVSKSSCDIKLGDKTIGAITREPVERLPVQKVAPPSIEYANVQRWIRNCETRHECDERIRTGANPAALRSFFIDVWAGRLVMKLIEETRFVALSYVRGGVDMFCTTSKNVDELQKPGAVVSSDLRLSRIVRDSLDFTAGLGVPYLWTDVLCIPQDDGPHKASMISHMDLIYSLSALTIVALCTDNADCALPGVLPGTRLTVPVPVEVTDEQDPYLKVHVARRPWLNKQFHRAVYNSRGWTFQERLLSRRSLIFTDHQVFFSCGRKLLTDGPMFEGDKIADELDFISGVAELAAANAINNSNSSDETAVRQHMMNRRATEFRLFCSLSTDFSSRNLTFQSDALAAMAGVHAFLARCLRWRFVAGLPDHLIHRCLLWRPGAANLDRNLDGSFPSWAPAGWVGTIDWSARAYWRRPGYPTSVNRSIYGSGSVFGHLFTEAEIEFVIIRGNASDGNAGDSAEKALCINAWTAPIRDLQLSSVRWNAVDILQHQLYEHCQNLRLRSDRGSNCGMLYGERIAGLPLWRKGNEFNRSYELVALSRFDWTGADVLLPQIQLVNTRETFNFMECYSFFCCDQDKYPFSKRCLINVMLIRWHGNYAERVTVGAMHVLAWKRIQYSVKKKIILR